MTSRGERAAPRLYVAAGAAIAPEPAGTGPDGLVGVLARVCRVLRSQLLAAGVVVTLMVHSVHAFPMRLRDRVIGALNVFGEEKLPLGEADARVIQALADVATISVIQEQAIAAAETLTKQLQGALNSRIVIEQAKGAVAQTFGVPV